MKANRFTLLPPLVAITLLSTSACGKAADPLAPPTATSSPAAPAVVTPVVATPEPVADWANLKTLTYDRRDELLTGLPALEARVDEQVSELNALRAALPAGTDTKDWDFAMKEMADARVYLKSVNADLAKASQENWDQQKDRVGQAWTRAQEAVVKVKTSTTIR